MEKAAKIPSRDSKTVREVLKLGITMMMAPSQQNSLKRRAVLVLLIIFSNLLSLYCIYARCHVMINHDLSEVLILMACVTAIPGEFHCISFFELTVVFQRGFCAFFASF